MKSFVCVVVGDAHVLEGDRNVVCVKINAYEPVWCLKDIIKHKRHYPFPSHELQLYVAKRANGQWLSSRDLDGQQLERGLVPTNLHELLTPANEMEASDRIDAFGFPNHHCTEDEDDDDNLHVLVVIPPRGLEAIRRLRERIRHEREERVRREAREDSMWEWLWPSSNK